MNNLKTKLKISRSYSLLFKKLKRKIKPSGISSWRSLLNHCISIITIEIKPIAMALREIILHIDIVKNQPEKTVIKRDNILHDKITN